MPLDNVARRYRELGRLKFGEDLGDRPAQLTTWRLTSPAGHLIEAAARLWGGVPTSSADREGLDLITDAEELEVLVPVQDVAAGQWWEHWTAGGLQRRCSGTALVEYDEHEPDGWRRVAPCVCEDENGPRICKPTTVLRVLLPQLPDLGVWRLTTRSLYAAQELPVTVGVLFGIYSDRETVPAVLALDRRTSKKPGQKPHHFTVPILRTASTLEELVLAAGDQPERLPSGRGEALQGPDEGAADSLPASEPRPTIPPAPVPDVAEAATNPDPGPLPPEKPPSPRQAALSELRDFLEDVDPGELPHTTAELEAFLGRLDELATAAGIWDSDALNLAAGKWLDAPEWEGADVVTARLRTFAQRAVLAVLGKEHP